MATENAGRLAFEELESVVRHVSEQLAVYRRRALSAEAQLRDSDELQQRLDADAALLVELRETLGSLEGELVAARASEERLQTEADALRAARDESQTAEHNAKRDAAAAKAARAVSSDKPAPHAVDARAHEALLDENLALRERLGDASERTKQLVERVRFVRQQLETGGDR